MAAGRAAGGVGSARDWDRVAMKLVRRRRRRGREEQESREAAR
jgi:hypothetical protein